MALSQENVGPIARGRPLWRVFDRFSPDLYVLCQTVDTHVRYAPLYIHTWVAAFGRRSAPAASVRVDAAAEEYARFLSRGQAACIRAWRESTGLGKTDFARQMGIPMRCLQQWVKGQRTVSRTSWERYFKGKV